MKKSVITLTFGDAAENHVGMEKLGCTLPKGSGFTLADLRDMQSSMEQKGVQTELLDLSLPYSDQEILPSAHLLVIRGGVNLLLDDSDGVKKLFEEQLTLDYDKKAYMYGRIVNKHSQWNLCFDTFSRDPDYAERKGRVINISEIPVLSRLYETLRAFIGEKGENMKVEANYYYDIDKCGIGYHGDLERRRVVGVRLGNTSMPLVFHWFYAYRAFLEPIEIMLHPGDIYVMSEKATGSDCKLKSEYVLKHAAGCAKFTSIS